MTTLPTRTTRRLSPALLAAIALTSAAVAVVALGVVHLGDGDGSRTAAAASTPAPAPSTPAPAPSGPVPRGLLDEDEPGRYVAPGEQVSFGDGSSGIIEDGELRVTVGAETSRIGLGELAGVARLAPYTVELGRTGSGYLVDDGDGEWSKLRLYVLDAPGVLVRAEVTGGVPFGAGFTSDDAGYRTYTTGEGARLYTGVSVGDPGRGRVRLHRWTASGSGGAVRLVPTDLGTFCFDYRVVAVERC